MMQKRLACTPPDQVRRARFTKRNHPAVQLIDSAYPIYDIWNKAHDPNYEITHQGQSDGHSATRV